MTALLGHRRRFVLAVAALGLVAGTAGQAKAGLSFTFNGTYPGTAFFVSDPVYDTHWLYGGIGGLTISVNGQSLTDVVSSVPGGGFGSNGVETDWSNPSVHTYVIDSEYWDLNGINPGGDRYYAQLRLSTLPIAVPTGDVQQNFPTNDIEAAMLADINNGFVSGSLELLVHGPLGEPVVIDGDIISMTASTTPEPSTVAMIVTGLPAGLFFWCWKRRRAAA